MNRMILALTALASTPFVSFTSHASIVSVGGAATWLVSPPVSALPGALTGPNAYVWNEKQNLAVGGIPSNIVINPSVNTGYTPQLNFVVGPNFDSHMIHFDRGLTALTCVGSATFSGQVLGVIYSGLWLSGSDPLFGSPGTTYHTFGWGRSYGMFLANSTVWVNGNTVSFDLRPNYAGILFSELRVLTRPVPSPATLAAGGLLALAGLRRRRTA
jgi:hypothetical protein